MRILVTRPEPEATTLQATLIALGHQAIASPLMSIRLYPPEDFGPGLIQALIVTSRNAVRALAESPRLSQVIDLPVFAVGPRSAQDAHDLGFRGVMEGAGSASDLPALIKAHADPAGGRLVHIAGYKLAFDLEGALRDMGFTYEAMRCYEARKAEALSAEAVRALSDGHVDAAVLMSPDAARTYVALLERADLVEPARSVACLCISQATADALGSFQPVSTRIADRPNSQEVLALVNRMAEQSSS